MLLTSRASLLLRLLLLLLRRTKSAPTLGGVGSVARGNREPVDKPKEPQLPLTASHGRNHQPTEPVRGRESEEQVALQHVDTLADGHAATATDFATQHLQRREEGI